MTHKLVRALQVSSITLVAGGLFACSDVAKSGASIFRPNVPVSKIAEVKQQRQTKSTVYLKGSVSKKIPFLDKEGYEIKDSTGTIFVLTKERSPEPKTEVLIKGEVQYRSIPLAGKDYGEVYIKEEERL